MLTAHRWIGRTLELDGQYPDFGEDEPSHATQTVTAGSVSAEKRDTAPAFTASELSTSKSTVQAATNTLPAKPKRAIATAPVAVVINAQTQTATPAKPEATPATTSAATSSITSSEAWFEALPASHHTLQLFVVSNLAKVQKLQTEHPEVALHSLKSPASDGRTIYYVVHGNFADTERAKLAFAKLPATLRKNQKFTLIKTAAALRNRIAAALASGDSTAYTLQLFVFGQRDNAEKLLQQFPDLPLWVHASGVSPQEYRVLLGHYGDAEIVTLRAREITRSFD